jgi:hypothetical protein
MASDHIVQLFALTFDRFLAGPDDGFEAKRFPLARPTVLSG